MKLELPKLIGHRGVKDLAPENTLDSIHKAISLNLKWVEVDVKISKNKIPFLLHDDKLNRTTNFKGNPINYNYNDISNMNCGLWFDKRYKNTYPPSLEEVLLLCNKKNIGVNIELKPNKGFEKKNVKAVVKLISKIKLKSKYYFSSFNWESVILVKKLLPKSFAGILIEKTNQKNLVKTLNKCKKYDLFSCGFNKKTLTKKNIDLCKKYGILITAYSSKKIKIKEAEKLWRLGVNTIFIDDPSNFKKYL